MIEPYTSSLPGGLSGGAPGGFPGGVPGGFPGGLPAGLGLTGAAVPGAPAGPALLRVNLALPLDRAPRVRRGSGAVSLASLGDVVRDPLVVSAFVLAVCVFVFAVYLDTSASAMRQARFDAVRTAVSDSARLAADLEQANQLVAKRARLEQQLREVAAVDHNRFAMAHVLDQLADVLGPNMWITSVGSDQPDQDGNVGFVVTGYAAGREDVARYRDRLEQSPFVANMQPDTLRERTLNGIPLLFFQLQGQSEIADSTFIETAPLGHERGEPVDALAGFITPAALASAFGRGPAIARPSGVGIGAGAAGEAVATTGVLDSTHGAPSAAAGGGPSRGTAPTSPHTSQATPSRPAPAPSRVSPLGTLDPSLVPPLRGPANAGSPTAPVSPPISGSSPATARPRPTGRGT